MNFPTPLLAAIEREIDRYGNGSSQVAHDDSLIVVLRLAATSITAATAELDQARQNLAEAPHGEWCATQVVRDEPSDCDCWKAKL